MPGSMSFGGRIVFAAVVLGAVLGCGPGNSSSGTGGGGGSTATGGAVGSGGHAGSGGQPSSGSGGLPGGGSGGQPGSGGQNTSGSGGQPGIGGQPSTGGQVETGGRPGSGGQVGSGGASTSDGGNPSDVGAGGSDGGSGGRPSTDGGTGVQELVHYYGRWNVLADKAITVNSGSHFTAQFTGTAIVARFDISTNLKSDMPTLAWQVDQGAWQEAEVAATVSLGTGLTAGTHTVTVMARALDENQSRWTPPLVSSITFLAFDVTGGTVQMSPRPVRPKLEILGTASPKAL